MRHIGQILRVFSHCLFYHFHLVPDLDASNEVDPEGDGDRKRQKSDRRRATTRVRLLLYDLKKLKF